MSNRSKVFLLSLAALLLLLQSCTVEKRRYTSGYHVVFNKSKEHRQIDPEVDVVTVAAMQNIAEDIAEVSDTSVADVIVESDPDRHQSIADVIAQGRTKRTSQHKKLPDIEKEKITKSRLLFSGDQMLPASDIKQLQAAESSGEGAAGVFSWIAFAFAVLSIAFVILAIAVNGWAGLGYIAMALVAGVLTAVLAVVAKILTDRKQITTPWNLWFALAVGAIWAIITLRILLERGG